MPVRSKARDQFYIARAEALNAYALLEKSVAFIFARSLDTDPRYATLIISKMINTRARNEIVQRIIDMRTNYTFRPFTNSLFSRIAELDGERNKLVHWHVEEADGAITLKPTDLLSKSGERMTETELDQLWSKALFVAQVVSDFEDHLIDWSRNPALHERFLQPLHYPPEPDDLLFRLYKALQRPPRSLQD